MTQRTLVPNAGAIGVALVAGLLTRIAALGSLALLFTYVMSGTASVQRAFGDHAAAAAQDAGLWLIIQRIP